ncbi:MAG: hypothetical protein IKX20_04655 [Paludibacteraceae bacterium]|nr:hypothetical protein [Paludibacteraceae bacterium]
MNMNFRFDIPTKLLFGCGELNRLPEEISQGSDKKVWWKCKLGHSWIASISSRQRGRGCPYCANKKILPGYNDLTTTHPQVASEWDYEKNGALTPEGVTSGSEHKVWWRCTNNHEWHATISNRVRGNGCPYCSGRVVTVGVNDLATLAPQLVDEWDSEKNGEVLPSMVLPGSNLKAWWICGKGHSWLATIASRVSGNGCPYCANKSVLPGYNDLATAEPMIASEWDYEKNKPLLPTEVVSKSGKKVYWRCANGHSWSAIIKSRTEGNGCPYCAKKRVDVGGTDLLTCFPEIASEWDFERNTIRPQDVTSGSSKEVWWKCSRCGYLWKTKVYHRTKGHGCPKCAKQQIGKINGKKVMCIETQMIFDNAAIAGKAVGVTAGAVSACARGETKTAGKFHWKYV